MAELWAAFHGAREVLTLGAIGALLAMEAEAGATARRTSGAPLAVLAEAGAAALRASGALLVMLAEAGAAAIPAMVALRAVLAEAGAAAIPALLAPLVVWTLLVDAPLDWMRRRGVRRCCRSCWGRPIHGGEL